MYIASYNYIPTAAGSCVLKASGLKPQRPASLSHPRGALRAPRNLLSLHPPGPWFSLPLTLRWRCRIGDGLRTGASDSVAIDVAPREQCPDIHAQCLEQDVRRSFHAHLRRIGRQEWHIIHLRRRAYRRNICSALASQFSRSSRAHGHIKGWRPTPRFPNVRTCHDAISQPVPRIY